MTANNTRRIGKYTLVERDAHGDSICKVKLGRKVLAVYCSIPDAIAHQCEWNEDYVAPVKIKSEPKVYSFTEEESKSIRSLSDLFSVIDKRAH